MQSRVVGMFEWIVAVGGLGAVTGLYQLPGLLAEGITRPAASSEELYAKWVVYVSILGMACAKAMEMWQRKLTIYKESYQGRLEATEARLEELVKDHEEERARNLKSKEDLAKDQEDRLKSKDSDIEYLKFQLEQEKQSSLRKVELIRNLNQQIIDQATTISEIARGATGNALQASENTRAAIRRMPRATGSEDSGLDIPAIKAPTEVVVVNNPAHPVPVTDAVQAQPETKSNSTQENSGS